MAGTLAGVTGVATIKTLLACLAVPDFTIDELAQQTGVSRRTVDTVVRRYPDAFDRLPSVKQDGPGRPAVRWRLRTDHLDEVLEAVETNQAALGTGWRSEIADAPAADTAETSLIMAAVAISRASDNPEQAMQLVAAARNSLAAAGFEPDGSPWAGQPDQELAGRARTIAAVTDVVDACLSNDQQRIDAAQAQAMPRLEDAKRYMSATEWIPLAQKVLLAPGTVLSAPVLVEKGSVGYFRKLFPTLKTYLQKKEVPAGFVFMADTRSEQSALPKPVTFLLNLESSAVPSKLGRAASTKFHDCVVVSKKPEVLAPAAESGADFILHRKNKTVKVEIANAVNSRAAWGVAPSDEDALTTGFHGAITLKSYGPGRKNDRKMAKRRRKLYLGAQRPTKPMMSERDEPSRETKGLAATPLPPIPTAKKYSSRYSSRSPGAGLTGGNIKQNLPSQWKR